MARRKSAEALAKQKEAKQKKLLIVLIPVFLLLAVWQGPKTFGALFSSSEPAVEAAETTSAAEQPAPAGDPAAPAEAEAPAGDVLLADSYPPPEPVVDRLVSFGLFATRDPFRMPPDMLDPSSPDGGSGTPSGGGSSPPPSSQPSSTLTTAVISVNGTTETLRVGSAFPTASPVFTLAAVRADGVEVGLVQGIFEDGSATVRIGVGERVQLISAPDTTRYTVELIEVR